jgi:hypothetical protein
MLQPDVLQPAVHLNPDVPLKWLRPDGLWVSLTDWIPHAGGESVDVPTPLGADAGMGDDRRWRGWLP